MARKRHHRLSRRVFCQRRTSHASTSNLCCVRSASLHIRLRHGGKLPSDIGRKRRSIRLLLFGFNGCFLLLGGTRCVALPHSFFQFLLVRRPNDYAIEQGAKFLALRVTNNRRRAFNTERTAGHGQTLARKVDTPGRNAKTHVVLTIGICRDRKRGGERHSSFYLNWLPQVKLSVNLARRFSTTNLLIE
ncbi:MAG: hypothetical protein JWL59_4968 [Chthoniobacteraceae bacterium]|nr:hypothetical protein [Chthoniobacteraceae bacterium]